MPFYKISKETGRISIYFEDFPPNSIRNQLKANGWRWNPEKKCWWNFNNSISIGFAKALCPSTPDPLKQQQPETIGSFQKGSCGASAIWLLSRNGQLLISGLGEIDGYSYEQYECSPWYNIRNIIQSIKIQNGITSIGKRAFYDFPNLITVPLCLGNQHGVHLGKGHGKYLFVGHSNFTHSFLKNMYSLTA